jgi:hypothetical protein
MNTTETLHVLTCSVCNCENTMHRICLPVWALYIMCSNFMCKYRTWADFPSLPRPHHQGPPPHSLRRPPRLLGLRLPTLLLQAALLLYNGAHLQTRTREVVYPRYFRSSVPLCTISRCMDARYHHELVTDLTWLSSLHCIFFPFILQPCNGTFKH